MKQRPMVDPHSYDLAEFFLGELPGATEDDIWELARILQTACEDACREVEERQPKDDVAHRLRAAQPKPKDAQ